MFYTCSIVPLNMIILWCTSTCINRPVFNLQQSMWYFRKSLIEMWCCLLYKSQRRLKSAERGVFVSRTSAAGEHVYRSKYLQSSRTWKKEEIFMFPSWIPCRKEVALTISFHSSRLVSMTELVRTEQMFWSKAPNIHSEDSISWLWMRFWSRWLAWNTTAAGVSSR